MDQPPFGSLGKYRVPFEVWNITCMLMQGVPGKISAKSITGVDICVGSKERDSKVPSRRRSQVQLLLHA